jgi:glycosyltransferase involved in cell wall biosynthesis
MTVTEAKTEIKLSIVIPCFNEERTLRDCVHKVLSISDENLALEIIIVDDCSKDYSYNIALDLAESHPEIHLLRHEENRGKCAALRTGFKNITGDFVAVQDADLEYDPNDLKRLLAPMVSGDADVVLGSRFLSTGFHRVFYFWHYLGNRLLTFLSNMFTDLNLTDMETCYKVFRREVILYLLIGGTAAIVNFLIFIFCINISLTVNFSAPISFAVAAIVNYILCIYILFRHKAQWSSGAEIAIYLFVVALVGLVDLIITKLLISLTASLELSKLIASAMVLILNFNGRRFLVFYNTSSGPWQPQDDKRTLN